MMGIEVEKLAALNPNEVVGGRGAAASYAERLRHLQGGFEGFPVYGIDTIDT